MPDEIKTDEIKSDALVGENGANETEDPSSEKELEGIDSEPEVDVKPEDVEPKDDGKALNEAVADEAEGSEDPVPLEPSEPSVEPSSTGESEPISTAGSDGATAASAPAAEPSESDAWEGPYEGLHEPAKAIEGFLGDERLGDLKAAGNALFHVAEDLIERDVSKLDPEPAAILANVRNHGAGFLAALEAVFKRTR